jgi:tellurite resistance protein TerA
MEAVYAVDLGLLPSWCERVAFTATIHEGQERGVSFASLAQVQVSVADEGGAALASFDMPTSGMSETAVILGELYRRNGQWKFRAVGQGFKGGLAPLASHFGVDVAGDPKPAPAAPPVAAPPPPPQPAPVRVVPPVAPAPAPAAAPPPPPPAPAPVAAPPAAPRINLSKVTLTKQDPKVSLAKRNDYGDITINLNWSRPKPGILGFRSKGVDLDVGCLYELMDGELGCIQALGNCFGDYNREPFIRLDSDDRSGASTDGEWIRVNGRYFSNIKRLLVFAFIYEGAPNWAQTDGVVTLAVPGEAPVEVRMTEGSGNSRMCAVALVENVNGAMRISREVQYFRGHDYMDKAFGWGLSWSAGSK